MADDRPQSMDVPTILLMGVFLISSILSTIFLLTGVGLISAAVTILVVRFFGRPNVAAYLVPIALAVILLDLFTSSGGPIIWVVAWKSAYQSIAMGTSPSELARIWIDPSRNGIDETVLSAFGIFFGGYAELTAEDGRNSKLGQLSLGKRRIGRRRAPIALICAWIASYRSPSRGESTFLGTDVYDGRSLYISDSDLNKHALVLGTTGKGKTTSLAALARAAMQNKQFTVWLDGKGDVELLERIRAFAVASKRPFYVFNTLNLNGSCAYNPLAAGDFTSKADRIMNLREWTEPHYESLAAAFLQTAFKILDHERIVIDVVQAAKSLSIKYLIKQLRSRGFSSTEKQKLADEISEQAVAEKTSIDSLRSDIRYIANSSLGILFDTAQARRDRRPILNLEEARKEGAVVYFLLSPLLFQKGAPKISRVIINDLKAITVSARSKFKLFVDESTFATEAALNLINMGRSFGVCAIFSSQSLSDFLAGARDLGAAFVSQVIASVNIYIIHQLNEPDEAETISRLIGTAADVELTAQSQDEKLTGAASVRNVREFKVHPDDLKYVRTGEAYVLNKNNGWSGKIKVRNSRI